MSYFPKRYPVLEQTEWILDDFAEGEHRGTACASRTLSLSPGSESGIYTTRLPWTMRAKSALMAKCLAAPTPSGPGSSKQTC